MNINNLNDDIINEKLEKYEKLNNELKKQLEKYNSLNIDDYKETFNKIMQETFNYSINKQKEGRKKDIKNANKYVKSIIYKVDDNEIKYIDSIIKYLNDLKQSLNNGL